MGEEKKNGVDRLVQFLNEGSPRLHKRQPNKMMTGQFQSIHVDRLTPRKQINWQKKRKVEKLEKTVEEIDWKKRQEGISEIGDHPTMGMNNVGDGKMLEAATASTYPHGDDEKQVGIKSIPKAVDWKNTKNASHVTVQKNIDIPSLFAKPTENVETGFPDPLETHEQEQQHRQTEKNIEKASLGETVGVHTPTNRNTRNANGIHPQDAFLEVAPDEDKRQQVIEQDDFENRVKKYNNKEDEKGNVDQPLERAGATANMANYPDSNMQMMEKSGWGSGIDINQDDLHRGGDLDEEDLDIDNNKDKPKDWVSEEEEAQTKAEKEWLEQIHRKHRNFIDEGDATPIISALLAFDDE